MRKRLLGVAVLVLALLAFAFLWLQTEGDWVRKGAARERLWTMNGEELVICARRAAEESPSESEEAPRKGTGAFSWEDLPDWCRQRVLKSGMQPTGTEAMDNCLVTTFTCPPDLNARWFYVVPLPEKSRRAWFLVVAMNSEYVIYDAWPHVRTEVIEKRASYPAGPLDIIRRICAQREAGR